MSQEEKKTRIGGAKDRPWNPRFWNGLTLAGLWRMMVDNGFRVTPRRWGMAGICVATGIYNSSHSLVHDLVFGRKIARTELPEDPIFIIGHWRSGTTLLHEMLIRDDRFTFPNTYDVFLPHHFLLTAKVVRPLVGWTMPKKRPMDNMATGWDHPQEDEFALSILGAKSPIVGLVAFPNNKPKTHDYLDLTDVPAADLEYWKKAMRRFLQCLTYREQKQILLKSPTHTARLGILSEMFPKAKFVHIARNPYTVFPSTCNLWMRLARVHGFQVPNGKGLEERVLATFERMYAAYYRDSATMPPDRLAEIRYEDLVADPLTEVSKIYEQLGLDSFEKMKPSLEKFLESQKDYKVNRYALDQDIQRQINARWTEYFDRFDYEVEEV